MEYDDYITDPMVAELRQGRYQRKNQIYVIHISGFSSGKLSMLVYL